MPPRRLVVLGHPVAHSLSPRMQQAALDAAGIAVRYEAVDVAPAALGSTLDALIAAEVWGNVTVPHKAAVAARCAVRTPIAEHSGAVNTFWVADGALHGDNTDVAGFDAAVRHLLGRAPEGLRVGLLGAGGAAAAVAAAVEGWSGATLHVHARSLDRVEALRRRFPDRITIGESPEAVAGQVDLLVNATPVGLSGDALPLDPMHIPRTTAVLDLTYRVGLTPWVRACRSAGRTADDGLRMLVEQGAHAFVRWFGTEPDRTVMWRALQAAGFA
ncbi:MAG: shikimate dehydrogenase family protein [Gemmatimonadota bacterium]